MAKKRAKTARRLPARAQWFRCSGCMDVSLRGNRAATCDICGGEVWATGLYQGSKKVRPTAR